ncbi:methanogen output domain 1-containing protein [Roseococcus microcysteis]|uniref:methanogen output domain 1-containing protein n=1 Tax=Roseococcus microcysteis TaxID=2771361 RepID=UPI00168BF441|nr:methanogen output domain 1-containing protein [Roseococcus microcysteis]
MSDHHSPVSPPPGDVAGLAVPLERDVFLRRLLRELSGALEDVVGLEEASGYISLVGAAMGEHIHDEYRRALAVGRLDRRQLAEVLVDLKRRIHGDFSILEEDENQIVFGNTACPFGDFVQGRPSLCMMTSNVFGAIAAESQGYAAVRLERTIAAGDPACRVVVLLRPDEAATPGAREYFRRDDVG